MSEWRGMLAAFVLGVVLAVGLQPVAHEPVPVWTDVQLPTLGVEP